MADYHAPIQDMLFVLRDLVPLAAINRLPGHEDSTYDVVEAVLGEAAQLAGEVIAPTNRIGDKEGTRVENGQVIVPPEFVEAYRQYAAGGWPGLSADTSVGGQGLPYVVGVAVEEMWQSANLAWSLGPLLSQGAARALQAHGTAELKRQYLEPLVCGKWTGTMVLTEPQAGSDLGALRTQAVRDGKQYRVSGQKIYITWGDHNLTDNVIHFVLARLPDGPPGTKGISLFLVPKHLLKPDGSLGARNSVTPVSVEHKLGIHGSPTCVLSFENAVGYLVGDEHDGMACMFTMMNHARLGVGMEGIAIAERAYQQALAYARERVQGKVVGAKGRAAIIEHPDVRRMLFTIKAQIEAMRAAVYTTVASLDYAHRAADEAVRAHHQARVELLTPVIKGWCTETGQMLTSLALQIHGGMGYIEETGAAQYYRDARIITIYEGTTGIQAGDFVGRKILRDGGAALRVLIGEIAATEAELIRPGSTLASVRASLAMGREALSGAARWLEANYSSDPRIAGAISYHLMMLTGILVGGWQLARSALIAHSRAGSGTDDAFLSAKITTARFYAEQIMPQVIACQRAIEGGTDALLTIRDDQF
jgi:alkylation response protein AidB-like acyl-CoA dehydrogenase